MTRSRTSALARAPLALARSVRAGFTLIELLAVIMIIGILATFLLPKIPEAIDSTEVTACKSNMREMYRGFMQYKQSLGRNPGSAPRGGEPASGVKFFADLIRTKTWSNDKSSAQKLQCPGVGTDVLINLQGLGETEWFSDFDIVDGNSSTYAGRNCAEFPLGKFPSDGLTVLVSDDNDHLPGKMNHRTATNVLLADGSVESYELIDLLDEGVLMEDELLIVGPDSQVDELRVLSLD